MRRLFIPLLCLCAALLLTPTSLAQVTLTVNTTDDDTDGTCDATHCSLREAITTANATPNKDVINFNLTSTPPFIIAPDTPLPFITQPVTINGASQLFGNPISLNGSSSTSPLLEAQVGLNIINTTNVDILGLAINGWAYGGIGILGGSTNFIGDNLIGLAADGMTPIPNLYGIIIYQSSINTVFNNVISGNGDDGINIGGNTAQLNSIQANIIGVLPGSTTVIGNGDDGLKIEDSYRNQVSHNVIAGSVHNGILVKGAGAVENRLTENMIYDNGLLGIALENGGNANIQPPSITWAWEDASLSAIIHVDAAPNTVYEVQLYGSDACDLSGAGEGRDMLGAQEISTNANGDATFTIITNQTLSAIVTATLMDSPGNTSAFSQCATLSADAAPQAAPRLNYVLGDEITLTWSDISWSAGYEVIVYQPNGENFFELVTDTTPQVMLSSLETGDYMWQVRGIDANDEPGPWSVPQSFVILAP